MSKLVEPGAREYLAVLMLGRRVQAAFAQAARAHRAAHAGIIVPDEIEHLRFFEGAEVFDPVGSGQLLYAFPHPSGTSRWWNRPANARRAERWCRRLLE